MPSVITLKTDLQRRKVTLTSLGGERGQWVATCSGFYPMQFHADGLSDVIGQFHANQSNFARVNMPGRGKLHHKTKERILREHAAADAALANGGVTNGVSSHVQTEDNAVKAEPVKTEEALLKKHSKAK